MQLKHLETIHPPQKKLLRISAMCWSNNNRRLAVADADGFVHLFDEAGKRRDKFPTKSQNGLRGGKRYSVKSMCFSPDDEKLAIAQSDNIVYVYKLGLEWGDRKSICNKYSEKNGGVTSCCWPLLHPQDVIYGLTDGRIRCGNMKTNKAMPLYSTESPVMSMARSPDGHGFVSGHADGSIYRYYFKDIEEAMIDPSGGLINVVGAGMGGQIGGPGMTNIVPGAQKIATHSCIPICIAWGQSIVVAGSDKRVAFYSPMGQFQQSFDLSSVQSQSGEPQAEFTSMSASPSGQAVALGSNNKIKLFTFNIERNLWEEGETHEIPNLYIPSSMSWKPDGSRLAIGNVCGAVELFDACIKRYRHKGEFEFTFVSPSQVIVKRLSSGARIILKSSFSYEILKLNVAKDQFLIANTPKTLLLGNLETYKLSEVPWQSSSNSQEKFYFDNPKVCLVYRAGEISVVEYGINDIIGSFHTEHVSSSLISVRVSYPNRPAVDGAIDPQTGLPIEGGKDALGASGILDAEGNKKVAFLLDSHTIRILDMVSSIVVANINHDCKIDWLELNHRGTKLLFRDKRHCLHLFDVAKQQRTTLLSFCSYVAWVPDSDVVVAQNRSDLCVWYSIDAPDRVTLTPIKGQVEDIVRANGVTTVIVDEGNGPANYDLEEGLIEFGTAMEDKDYDRAADFLESMHMSPEIEAMWKNLSELVMRDQQYLIAERCFAALGNISKARYLRKLHKELRRLADSEEEQEGAGMGIYHWKIRAKLAMLDKDFKTAEQIFLEQGKVQDAMDMYKSLHRFEESINLAIARGLPDAEKTKATYINWLISTKQEEKAARIYEQDGKITEAINMFLKGGFPASAANVVIKHGISGGYHQGLLDTIADKLKESGLWTKAGEFYEKQKSYDKAVDCYCRGNSYRNAVELARNVMPEQVIKLEEDWGDYLTSQKQFEGAVNHYVEANQYIKAIEAAITARQWSKAEQILVGLDDAVARQYSARIAKHYEEIRNYDSAKSLYMKAGMPKEAMRMFEDAGKWEEVLIIAEKFMSPQEIAVLNTQQAGRLESRGRFKDAEKLYIKAGEVDTAINMYKMNHMFDDMIRLVSQHRNVHLAKAHLQIAQKLESEGQLRQAEHHYVQAGEWKAAVNMYRNNDKWNEALQVAKAHGSAAAWRKVAKEWAVTMGGESGGEAGAKLLYKLNLVDEAIDYCVERNLWNLAFDMARTSLKSKLPDVHLKYAIILEDNRRFKEAEDEYINANAPKEAIEMYIHEEQWGEAMRVAETYEPTLIAYVIEQQAEAAFDEGEAERAEQLYLQAKKPERLIQKYKEAGRFEDAKRVADKFLGTDAQRMVQQEWAQKQMGGGSGSVGEASSPVLASSPVFPQSAASQASAAAPTGPIVTPIARQSTGNDPASAARMFYESGQYSKAIDAYLQINDNQYSSEQVDSHWISAVNIAIANLQARLGEVCQEVVRRFLSRNKIKQAGGVLVLTGQIKEAVELYAKQQMWNEARGVAQTKGRTDLVIWVDQQYKKTLQTQSSGESQQGSLLSQLQALADRQQYEDCITLALQNRAKLREAKSEELILRYVADFVRQLVRSLQPPLMHVKALEALNQYGVPLEPNMFVVYKEIAKRIIWSVKPQESTQTLQMLCDVLKQLLDGIRNAQGQVFTSSQTTELARYYDLVHLMTMRRVAEEGQLPKEILAKICISLVRYSDIAPADVLLYQAGQACKGAGWNGMAFVFLNRFLYICDAIEEMEEDQDVLTRGSNANPILILNGQQNGELAVAKGMVELDNKDFAGTDIPFYVPVPRELHIDEDDKDAAIDYVTMEAVGDKSQHVLSKSARCENCLNDMYVAGITCPTCSCSYEPCAITGYPVFKSTRVECSNPQCRKPANKDDWNSFMMKLGQEPHCPHCHEYTTIM